MGSSPWDSVLGQAEHALAQDVAQDLGGAGADAAAAREQAVELPLALVGRVRAARLDLRVGSDDLGGQLGQLLVEQAPEELGGGALRPRRAAAQDLGEAAVAVELWHPVAGRLRAVLPAHPPV